VSEQSHIDKAVLIASAAEDLKAERVVALDVREVTSFADSFVLASGTSDRHVQAIADAIEAAVKAAGHSVLGVEGYDDGRWILIDCGDAIVHIFQAEVREHYDLERLWSDAPEIDCDTAALASRDGAAR
jgi:ribosome-associated protein